MLTPEKMNRLQAVKNGWRGSKIYRQPWKAEFVNVEH